VGRTAAPNVSITRRPGCDERCYCPEGRWPRESSPGTRSVWAVGCMQCVRPVRPKPEWSGGWAAKVV